ncbi:MAG: pitrilysin family protein [Pseudomonadota bacterium]
MSRDDALSFYQRYYRPDNMVLVMAGDFSPDQIRPVIEKHFGGAKPGAGAARTVPAEPPQGELRTVVIRDNVTTAKISMGFRIPGFKSPDVKALDLLASILGQGRTSRLHVKVLREKELVSAVMAGTYAPADPGLLLIAADLDPDQVGSAVKAIIDEVWRLSREAVSTEELARAKLNAMAAAIKARDSMSGEAADAAEWQVLGGDFRLRDQYQAEMEKLTPADLLKVAALYFRPENLTVAALLPRDRAAEVDEATLASAVMFQDKTVHRYELPGGSILLVKPDHSLPLVSVRAAFLAGLRYEGPSESGLSNFTAEVWDRGTTSLTAEELDRKVEDLAADLSTFSGRFSFGLEAGLLSWNIMPGLRLFMDVLTKPAFDPREVEKSRVRILAEIKRRDDQLMARSFILFARTLFEGSPLGRDVLGSPDSVAKFQAGDLRNFYDKWARPDNLVLTVVGNVDPVEIKSELEQMLADRPGRAAKAPAPRTPPTWKGLRTAWDKVEKAQSHLVLGYPAPGLKSPDRFALDVLDKILSGQGGRLFTRLRDQKSLAYSLGSFHQPGLEYGSFGMYLGFDPAKLGEVRAGLAEIVAEIISTPVSELELAGAKQYILGSYEVGLQSYSAQASDLGYNELYGLGHDYQEKYAAGINAVTGADVLRVARRYLDPGQAVEVLVGPSR